MHIVPVITVILTSSALFIFNYFRKYDFNHFYKEFSNEQVISGFGKGLFEDDLIWQESDQFTNPENKELLKQSFKQIASTHDLVQKNISQSRKNTTSIIIKDLVKGLLRPAGSKTTEDNSPLNQTGTPSFPFTKAKEQGIPNSGQESRSGSSMNIKEKVLRHKGKCTEMSFRRTSKVHYIAEPDYNPHRYVNIGCKDSVHALPEFVCKIQCNDCECSSALDYCSKLPGCSALAFWGKPACKKGKKPALKHYISDEEYSCLQNAQSEIAIENNAECLKLGSSLVQDNSFGKYDAEISQVVGQIQKKKVPILFVHIQKAGGTTLCRMAKQNGLKIPAESPADAATIMGKNCNPSSAHIMKAWHGMATQQLQYTQEQDINFYGNEKFLPADLPWGQMAFLVVLRHPVDRFISHFLGFGSFCASGSKAKSFSKYVECAEQNFMVRRLAGCMGEGRNLGGCRGPKGKRHVSNIPMTRQHLDWAKDRLERFTVVLVTEMLGKSGAYLEKYLAWKISDLNKSRSGSANPISADDVDRAVPNIVEKIESYNSLDMELYEHAKKISCRILHLLSNT